MSSAACALCVALETLAKGVHSYINQNHHSTTSASYSEGNDTIYICSQRPNQTLYSLATPAGAEEAVRNDARLEAAEKLSHASQQQVKSGVQPSNHPVLTVGRSKKKAHSHKKAEAGSDAHSYTLEWAKGCYEDEDGEDWPFGEVQIKIIFEADVFACAAENCAGFHSESRVMRYLGIKDTRQLMTGKIMSSPATTLEGDLKLRFATKPVHMGSSKPACQDCSEYMSKLGIHHESRSGKPAASGHQWINPFTLGEPIDPDLAIMDAAHGQVEERERKKSAKNSVKKKESGGNSNMGDDE
jgi:hypothetical protein